MTTEEISRRMLEAFNAQDLDAMLELYAPDAEVVPVRGALEGIVYRGHEGVRELERESAATWSERRLEDDSVEVRGDKALMLGRLSMRGRASGALTEQRAAFALHVRDGRIARLATHFDEAAARRELGWDG
ncbi:MAG TPA: nuclear transport factor 2 family protein [Thermoleophilaceae bacterium]